MVALDAVVAVLLLMAVCGLLAGVLRWTGGVGLMGLVRTAVVHPSHHPGTPLPASDAVMPPCSPPTPATQRDPPQERPLAVSPGSVQRSTTNPGL